MAGRNVRVPLETKAFFEPLSLGRGGPGARRATPADVAQVSRIVRSAPEVMVKVTGGSGGPSGVGAALRYVGRDDTLPIETDTGEAILTKAQRAELVKSWNLDLVRGRYRRHGDRDLDDLERRRKPRVAYHLVLGMPSSTPPKAVLQASRQFAREQFGATHRYAMVLHTDQAHPHVHLIVKAEDEQGQRLRIDKAKLRAWRERFAEALRDQGIEANASSRFERGRHGRRLNSRTLRVAQRNHSASWRNKVRAVRHELSTQGRYVDPDRPALEASRNSLRQQWLKTAASLDAQGLAAISGAVKQFARALPEIETSRERIAAALVRQWQAKRPREREIDRELERSRSREREQELTR
jgi:hypothetical protein